MIGIRSCLWTGAVSYGRIAPGSSPNLQGACLSDADRAVLAPFPSALTSAPGARPRSSGKNDEAAVNVLATRYEITAHTVRHVRVRQMWKHVLISTDVDETARHH